MNKLPFPVVLFPAALCLASGVAPAQTVELRTVALSGEQAAGLPAGVVYESFGVSFGDLRINDAGRVTFIPRLVGPGVVFNGNDNGTFVSTPGSGPSSGISLIARAGDPAPDLPGVDYGLFTVGGPRLGGESTVAFFRTLDGPGITGENDEALFTNAGGQGIEPVARRGDPAPELPGVTWDPFGPPVLNRADQLLVTSFLEGAGVTANTFAVHTDLDPAPGGDGFRLRVRTDDPAPGIGAGNTFRSLGRLAFNDNGRFVLEATIEGPGATVDDDTVLYRDLNGSFELLGREGFPAPGAGPGVTFGRTFIFRSLLLNNNNNAAFDTFINDGSLRDEIAFFVGVGGPNPRAVARSGVPVPYLPQGTQFGAFPQSAYSDTEDWAFLADLADASGPGVIGEAIVAGIGGSGPRVIARTGQPAPGAPPDVTFEEFGIYTPLSFGDSGRLVFMATLTGDRPAIFALDSGGTPRLIVAAGQTVDVNNDPGIEDLREIDFFAQNDYARNNSNQIAFTAAFTDGSSAVMVGKLVEPCPADFNGDGSINVLDVLGFINVWNAQGPGADFNGDGAINVLDVVAFINTWNAGCP